MKQYIVDTNIVLRLILNDHPHVSKKAAFHFEQAKEGSIKLLILPEVFFEIEYVLRKLYKAERQIIYDIISKLIKTPYVSTK
jgi:predicted nucleic-acid-binding protein